MRHDRHNELDKKVRGRFILVGCLSIIVVTLSLQFANNLFTINQTNQLFKGFLERVIESGGRENPNNLPDGSHELNAYIEKGFAANSFAVIITQSGQAELIATTNSAKYEDVYLELTQQVLASGEVRGNINSYHYLMGQYNGSTIIAFGDFWQEELLSGIFTQNSISAAVISMVLLLILLVYFSAKIVRPITNNIVSQKTFISDAGHELKTPVAIISANAEMLAAENGGENTYIKNIQSQTQRMNSLIEKLLMLSALNEQKAANFSKFDLSEMIIDVSKTFEIIASQKNCLLNYDIDTDLSLHGESKSLQEMIIILLDNAIKYSPADSSIDISLKQHGSKIMLKIQNKIEKDSIIETEKLFTRFYRSDTSRARASGGYGLGLSIAESIIGLHNGMIEAKIIKASTADDNDAIAFIVLL